MCDSLHTRDKENKNYAVASAVRKHCDSQDDSAQYIPRIMIASKLHGTRDHTPTSIVSGMELAVLSDLVENLKLLLTSKTCYINSSRLSKE